MVWRWLEVAALTGCATVLSGVALLLAYPTWFVLYLVVLTPDWGQWGSDQLVLIAVGVGLAAVTVASACAASLAGLVACVRVARVLWLALARPPRGRLPSVVARVAHGERCLGDELAALRALEEDLGELDAADRDVLRDVRAVLASRRRKARGALARLAAADALTNTDCAADVGDARARADAWLELAGVRAA